MKNFKYKDFPSAFFKILLITVSVAAMTGAIISIEESVERSKIGEIVTASIGIDQPTETIWQITVPAKMNLEQAFQVAEIFDHGRSRTIRPYFPLDIRYDCENGEMCSVFFENVYEVLTKKHNQEGTTIFYPCSCNDNVTLLKVQYLY